MSKEFPSKSRTPIARVSGSTNLGHGFEENVIIKRVRKVDSDRRKMRTEVLKDDPQIRHIEEVVITKHA